MNDRIPSDRLVPGLVYDLSNEEYHAGDGISKSGLDDFARSPEIYYALHKDPKRPARETKAGQLEGTLAHCSVLEPNEFNHRYLVIPADAPRRPTEAQLNAKNPSPQSVAAMSWWEDFNARNGGKQIITGDQYEVAMRQAESVRRLPQVAEILSAGHAEVSAYWTDPKTGVLCRCRPDWKHPAGSGSILMDLKTCGDASPAEFARQIARKSYHRQDAFYSDGYRMASGEDVLAFIFVAVESQYPYAACATMLDDDGREQGRAENRRLIDRYADCLVTDIWPGYSKEIEMVSLPAWALDK